MYRGTTSKFYAQLSDIHHSTCTTRVWPLRHAQCRALEPLSFCPLTSAPRCMRNFTVSGLLSLAAQSMGKSFFSLAKSTGIPHSLMKYVTNNTNFMAWMPVIKSSSLLTNCKPFPLKMSSNQRNHETTQTLLSTFLSTYQYQI